MKSAVFAASAFLATSSYASNITISTTQCLESVSLVQFNITFDTVAPVPVNLAEVCGLEIVSVSAGVNIDEVKCQAFRDAAGTQPGSDFFTFGQPASIATNPIQEQSVLCVPYKNSGSIYRRQSNSTSTVSSSSSVAMSTVLQTSTVAASGSASAAASSATISTVSGMPTASGNSTAVGTKGGPSATVSAFPTAGAGTLGVGAGVVAAAFAALLL